MIHVRGLRYTYPPMMPGDNVWHVALDDLSFEIEPGACLAVTGPNGCGKTTLCLAVAGLAPRLTVGRVEGEVVVAGHNVQAEPPGALADTIGLVLQDPTGQLFNPTVADEIAWGLENLGVAPDEITQRIEWALHAVGLERVPRDQPPHTLSGGQQKRLALAAALALKPAVLILDEPSGGLAPAACTEMIAVLRDLRASQGLTILFSESDPSVITALADEVAVLRAGKLIDHGVTRAVYTTGVVPGVSTPPASQFAEVVNASGRLHLTCVTAQEAIEQTRRYVPHSNGTKPVVGAKPGGEKVVELEQLTFAYHPERPVLKGIDLAVHGGEFVVLTGDNGAGKTTLCKHLVGLLRPTGGRVRLRGEDTAGQSIGQMARQVGFAFQNPELQIFNPTVREEVSFGPRNIGMAEGEIADAVESALRRFGLSDLADYPPAALTFGARRLVALAGVAAANTPIIVLDEPTVGLDAVGQQRVLAWLKERRGGGAAIILITHDMEVAGALAQRMIVMHEGSLVADGPPGEVFAQPGVLRPAGLHPPFAMQLAEGLAQPFLAADLTPQGAARALLGGMP